MPGQSSGYLPPIVARVIAESDQFRRGIAADIALLKRLAEVETNPRVGLDSTRLQTELGAVKTELLGFAQQVYDARLGADARPIISKIAEIRSELRALSPFDINIDANIASAEAKIAVLREQLAGLQLDRMLTPDLGAINAGLAAWGGERATVPGAIASPGLGTFLATLLGGGLVAGARGGGGLLGGLGWGKGLLGMAGFGSLLSLMGFGAEHLGATGVGIGGSLLGAGLGAGLLGLGSMGVTAVGMGTDMAGLGQASNDIKAVVQAQNQLNQAIAVYGRNSLQAQQAQAQLNYTLGSFSKVARGAVLAAANTAQQFHQMFNQATGLAEKRGAEILRQLMLVGEKFLPTLGSYAAKNMAIIQRTMQPLMRWFQSSSKYGGLGIFKDLESIFTKNLPTGMHALTQGIELFAKVVRDAAQYVGPFLHAVDRLLTRLNSPGHAAALAHTIGHLIGLFRSWLRFFINAGKVVFDLFKPAVGLGKAFANLFAGIFGQLAKWLSSPAIRNGLHGLFSVHLQEVIAGIGGVLRALMPFLEAAAQGFIAIATAGARLATGPLRAVGTLLRWIMDIPFLKQVLPWVAAILLVGRAFRMVWAANPWLLALVAAIVAVSFAINHWKAITKAFGTAWKAVWGAVKTAWNTVWDAIKAAAGAVWGFLRSKWGMLLAAFTPPIGPLVELGVHWRQTWDAIKAVAVAVWDALKAAWGAFWTDLKSILNAALAVIEGVAQAGWDTLKAIFVSAWDVLKGIVQTAWELIKGAVQTGIDACQTVINVVLDIIRGDWGKAWNDLWNGLKRVASDIWNTVANMMHTIVHTILSAAANFGSLLFDAGKALIQGLINGIGSMASSLFGAIGGLAKKAATYITHPWKIFSPSKLTFGYGVNFVQGLVNGINAAAPMVGQAVQTMAARAATALRQAAGGGGGPLAAALGQWGKQWTIPTSPTAAGVGGSANSASNIVQALTSLFQGLAEAAQAAGAVTNTTIASIQTAVATLVAGLQTDGPAMAAAFKQLGAELATLGLGSSSAASAGTAATNAGNVFSAISNLLNGVSSSAQSAAQYTTGSVTQITAALQQLTSDVSGDNGGVVAALQQLGTAFAALGGTAGSSQVTNIQNAATALQAVDSVFQAVNSAATDAGNVTPAAIQTIAAAVQTLAVQVQQNMGTTLTVFQNIGLSWIRALATGVSQGASGLTAAFTQVVAHIQVLLALAVKDAHQAGLEIASSLSATSGSVAAVPRGPGGGGGGPTVSTVYHINVHAPTGNAADISKTLQQALAEHDRQLVRQLRAGSAYR